MEDKDGRLAERRIMHVELDDYFSSFCSCPSRDLAYELAPHAAAFEINVGGSTVGLSEDVVIKLK